MQTRDTVRQTLDANFKLLMDCLGQLTEEELTSEAVTGDWNAKDVLAHVWTWNNMGLQAAKTWMAARVEADVNHDDAWSAAQVASRSSLPLITVVDGITGSHRRLMHFLDLADDAALAQEAAAPWGPQMTLLQLFQELAGHYAEHAAEMGIYQGRCLEGDAAADPGKAQAAH